MNDITERLRSLYVQHGTDYVQEAADEIERLRDELSDAAIKLENEKIGAEEIYQENDRVMHDCQSFLNEIERLRAENATLQAEMDGEIQAAKTHIDAYLEANEQLRAELDAARRTAEYWKAEPSCR